MNLLLNCCCEIPTDELKRFSLYMPWTLFPQIDDQFGSAAYNSSTHSWVAYRTNQWCFTKFTKLTITETNHTGTRVVVKQWDPDSGKAYADSITAPGGFASYNGYTLPSGAGPNGDNGTGITDTDYTTSFERVLTFDYTYIGAIPTPPFIGPISASGSVTYLFENPIYFDEQMVVFRERLEELCPLEDMKLPQSFAIPYYSGVTLLSSTVDLRFFSEISGDYQTNNLIVRPTATAPWDENYIVMEFGIAFPGLNDRHPFGASPYFSAVFGSDSQEFYGHIVDTDNCYLTAGCLSILTPIDCDNPAPYLQDVVVVESNLGDGDDSAMVIGPGGVTIGPGWHAFNGVRTHSFSGSITGPTNIASDAYGWVAFRVDYADPGTTHPEIYTTNHAPDNCPP